MTHEEISAFAAGTAEIWRGSPLNKTRKEKPMHDNEGKPYLMLRTAVEICSTKSDAAPAHSSGETLPSSTGSVPECDVAAGEMSLTRCTFDGECDFCPEERREVTVPTWVALSQTQDGTESDYYICAKCLPSHYEKWKRERQEEEDFARAEEEAHNGGLSDGGTAT